MELLTVPPPTATTPTRYIFFDDQNNRHVSSTSTATPPNHQLQLQLPVRSPKQKLSLISSKPLPPQTPTWSSNNTKTKKIKEKKKKKKTKACSTSDILSLMEALYNPIPIDIYTSLIKEVTLSGDPVAALRLHAHLTNTTGTINYNPPIPFLNRFLIMFVSCGLLENARQLFDKMSKRDFNSWATLFVAHYNDADYDESVKFFVRMIEDLGMMEFPSWIWCCLLKACACSVNFHLGMQVHGWLLKLGNCDDDAILSSSLITFYGRFNCLEDANVVFNRAVRHNTMTWTAKILGRCWEKQFSEALCDFKEMGRQGIKKDSFTFSSVLKACGKMLDHERCGEQVHADAIKLGLVSDNYVRCSLIAMYGRSGLLREAEQVFKKARNEGNDDCWNAMLMGYIENGMYIEAVKFLYQMKRAGMKPPEYLLNEVRSACGSLNC